MHCVRCQFRPWINGVCFFRTLRSCLPKLALYQRYVLIISWKPIKFEIRIGVSFLKISLWEPLEVEPDAGSPCRDPVHGICRTGSQFRGCNSTSDLVSTFVTLVMKNRVVGSQTMSILRVGSQHRAICRAESQCRTWGCKVA